jgi:arabinose-5-phosphate isomerase
MTTESQHLTHDFGNTARRVIAEETKAILSLNEAIGPSFSAACQAILACQGKVILIGMGKSGHIARKIAATLSSTGTPAHFVHPSEASHGDMGMITPNDISIILSNSGNTSEIVDILPTMKRQHIPIIAITSRPQSTLAEQADIHINLNITEEACSLGLAPTSSTTATLVMGDALSIALLEDKSFTADDFAHFHPAGSLGKRLLLRTKDIMHTGQSIPIVSTSHTIAETLLMMTAKSFGIAGIVNADNQLVGIFTDGDLRRALEKKHMIDSTPINTVMTTAPQIIGPDALAQAALALMEEKHITALFVTTSTQTVAGILHMHDLLRAGII